ncbi:hypothetical protein QTP88_008193 [Uroleucon formosanum]
MEMNNFQTGNKFFAWEWLLKQKNQARAAVKTNVEINIVIENPNQKCFTEIWLLLH